ncbi:DUF2690 domain-containing protein [Streptomyces mirabilis]|uniref:DUF2690 domain-containing protein n=1 Tax=Streptomyces mirabilis TaxID=68239 RepID=UPI0036B49031
MAFGHFSQGQPPEDPVEALRAELLAVKQASGLSYARLGARTHYAKSSWERWVNGKQFPPRAAVESLAAALELDPERLLALWERADEARADATGADATGADEGGVGESANGAGGPEEPAHGAGDGAVAEADTSATLRQRLAGRRRLLFVGAACLLGAAVSVAAVLATGGDSHDAPAASKAAAATGSAQPPTPQCRAAGCGGKDPAATHCGLDGQTLTLTRNKDIVIELRYSKACAAAWGRITYASKSAIVDADNSAGDSFATPVHWGNDVYSPMVAVTGRMTAWACGTQPNGGARECTRHMPVPGTPQG